MKQYQDLLKTILEKGIKSDDRTGTGTISYFGTQHRFDLSEGFPLVTIKKTFFRGVVHELLWFLRGETNIKYLLDNDIHIWDEWADDNGELGPIYGKQWRTWENNGIVYDQIKEVIELIKNDPNSRRLIVNAWNVGDLSSMALMPCHVMFQFYVRDGKLSCQLYQR